jgi:hypothetical protein
MADLSSEQFIQLRVTPSLRLEESMAANSEVTTQVPHASIGAAQIAILMCTKTGWRFLVIS